MSEELNWRQEDLLDCVADLRLYSFMQIAREIATAIKDEAQQGATDQEWLDSQAMCVVEEAGEFIGEYRRLRGFARRPGDKKAMLSELADVIIAASFMFCFLQDAEPVDSRHTVDLHDEVQKKLRKIVTRGFVNKDPEVTVP